MGKGDHLLKWLILILMGSFLVRAWGISYGLPYGYVPDEIVVRALRFGLGDLNPHWFIYPTLFLYFVFFLYGVYFLFGHLLGYFPSIQDFATSFLSDPSSFYLIARYTTAILGTLTVGLVFLAGKDLYNRKVGLVASLFLGFTYLHVKCSHFATTDVPMTFLLVLSFMFAARFLKEQSWKYYFGAWFTAGLAIATKYPAGLIIIPLFIAHILTKPRNKAIQYLGIDKRLLLGVFCMLIGFFIGCPYSILDFPTFRYWINVLLERSKSGFLGLENMASGWVFYIKEALWKGMGPPLEILTLGALLYGIIRHRKKEIFLVSFPLIYYIVMGSSKLIYPRFIIPLLPFLAILGARFLLTLVEKIPLSEQRRTMILLASLLLVISPSLRQIIRYDYLSTQTDTRTKAMEWIETNIPEGTKIALEAHPPPLLATKDVLAQELEEIREKNPKLGNKTEYLLNLDTTKRRYHLKEMSQFEEKDYEVDFYRKDKFEYVILSSMEYERFKAAQDKYPTQIKFYQWVEDNGQMIKEFKPERSLGPTIKIYRMSRK